MRQVLSESAPLLLPIAHDALTVRISRHRRASACSIAYVNMPQMNGLELYRRLTGSGKPIPTILSTTYPDETVRARALGDGVICYLSKPFDEDDVLTRIRPALGAPRRERLL